jgi:hypothetical protein
VYRCPDGRKMRAHKETKPYQTEHSWTLIPLDDNEAFVKLPTRERISRLLILEETGIYYISFDDGPCLRDTGWTVAELVFEAAP